MAANDIIRPKNPQCENPQYNERAQGLSKNDLGDLKGVG
jgi:hypothetical protein